MKADTAGKVRPTVTARYPTDICTDSFLLTSVQVYRLHLLTCLNTATEMQENVRNVGSGVAMGWAKSGGPRVPGQNFLLHGRLVHVGETFNRFADFGL